MPTGMGFDPATLITQGAGTIFGLALQDYNDQRQLSQQQKLQQLQIRGQKEMTDYNMSKQLQMWKDTNYPAQIEQLKQAGLNPALIYGTSGGGATTTGSANGNVSGAEAPRGGQEIIAEQGMAMQLALQKAQIANINADTENKKAENPNIPKTGTNIDADTALKQSQAKLQSIQAQIQGATIDDQIKLIQETADQSVTTADILTNQLSLDRQTRELKVTQLQTDIADTLVKIALGKSQQKVNDQTIEKMKVDMKNAIQTTDQNERQLYINALKADFEMNHPGIWNVIGGAIQGAAQKLGQAMGDKAQNTAEGAATKHK